MTVDIDLASADIAELQALLSAGEITSTALVRRCLARIDAFDVAGPELNAMIYVNPNVLAEAQRMDAARAADAVRGPLQRIGEDQKGAGNCRLAAATGLPAISVPAGFTDDGLPVGVELFGREFDEAGLLRLAFAYEQATHHRRVPPTTPTLAQEMDIR